MKTNTVAPAAPTTVVTPTPPTVNVPRRTRAAIDIVFEFLNSLRSMLVLWLKQTFPGLSWEDCEDLVAQLLIDIWVKGIGMLGIEELPSFEVQLQADDLKELLTFLCKKIVGRMKKHLYRRAIQLIRYRSSIKNGGGCVHTSIDEAAELIEDPNCRSSVLESVELLAELVEWFHDGLSERERVVFDLWLQFAPDRPSLAELYEELTPAQCLLFLPKDARELDGDARALAIKAQLSRTRSAVEAKIKAFGKDDQTE